jgi:FkbM family methyltransferase
VQDLLRIVDVGANPMYFDTPYKLMLENGFCQLTGFEPQSEALEQLNNQKGPNEIYLSAALGDGKSHELNIHRGSGLTSLLKVRDRTLTYLRGLRRAAKLRETVRIDTFRLDEVTEIERVDFLKIDIQGAELSVFENGTQALRSVLAIQTEVSFFPLYDNQPSFGDVDVFLRKQGFVPHSFLHVEKRLVLSQLGRSLDKRMATQMLDGDILYMRDLSQMEALTDEDIARIALIAEGIFGFTDIVLRCLEALHQRNAITTDQISDYLKKTDAKVA